MSGNEEVTLLFINHWAADCGGAEYSLIDIVKYAATVAKTYLITTEDGELIKRIDGTRNTSIIIPCTPNILGIKREHLFRTLLVNWKGVMAFLRFVYHVNKWVCMIRPDCIHANVPKSHMTLLLLKLIGYRGRCIIHMRELFDKSSIVMFLYRLMFRMAGATEIIAISNTVRDSLPVYLRRHTEVIYNGVTIGAGKNTVTNGLPIRFLFLGRIVPWKGCDLLIEAFESVMKKAGTAGARLTLIGDTSYWDGSYRKKLTGLIAKSCAATSIDLLEKTDDPMAVLRQHDVLCLPSQNEPFGRVAAEAQGAGMPVIGFTSGGVPEIVVNVTTGFLVPDQDGDAFAEAMLRFIENPLLVAQMGSRGRDRALELFDNKNQVPKIVRMILGAPGETS